MTSSIVQVASPVGPASETQLVAFETLDGITLPDDYRVFLKEFNGCILSRQLLPFDNWGEPDERVLECLRGIHDYVVPIGVDGQYFRNAEYIADQHADDHVPSDQLLVIADDGCGNELVMQLGDEGRERIYLYEHETDHLCPVAGSFTDFLQCLKPLPPGNYGSHRTDYPQITLQPIPAESSIPRCPQCGELLRTSLAKQCFGCGADWH